MIDPLVNATGPLATIDVVIISMNEPLPTTPTLQSKTAPAPTPALVANLAQVAVRGLPLNASAVAVVIAAKVEVPPVCVAQTVLLLEGQVASST